MTIKQNRKTIKNKKQKNEHRKNNDLLPKRRKHETAEPERPG
jgi:hypothetical protein